MVFPVYWVFRDLAGWRDAAVLSCTSSDPRLLVGVALRRSGRLRVLAANMTPDVRDAHVALGTSISEARLAFVDQASFDVPPADTLSMPRRSSTVPAPDGTVRVTLGPYAVVCVDA